MMLSRGGTPVGIPRREPCHSCGQPVYIAERLTVAGLLYHRTCFRCARCGGQLTLASYYETETGRQYCCEVCPDEESKTDDSVWQASDGGGVTVDGTVKSDCQVAMPSVWEVAKADAQKLWEQRSTEAPLRIVSSSLSDEEKSAGLAYQTAHSDVFSETSQPSMTRTHFITALLSEDGDEKQPPLPDTKPPDLNSSDGSSCNNNNNRLNNENISDLVNSDVTKEYVEGSTSLVQTRMRLFERNQVQSVDGSIIVISDDSENIINIDDSTDVFNDDRLIRTKHNKISRVKSEDITESDNKVSSKLSLVESPKRTNKINRVKSEDITESDNKVSSQHEQMKLSNVTKQVKSNEQNEEEMINKLETEVNTTSNLNKIKSEATAINRVKLAASKFESQATPSKSVFKSTEIKNKVKSSANSVIPTVKITNEMETKCSEAQDNEIKLQSQIESETNLPSSIENTEDIDMPLVTCTNKSEIEEINKNASEITFEKSLDIEMKPVTNTEIKLAACTTKITSDTSTVDIKLEANEAEINSDTKTIEMKSDANIVDINSDTDTVETKSNVSTKEITTDITKVEVVSDVSTGEMNLNDVKTVEMQSADDTTEIRPFSTTDMNLVTNTELKQQNSDRIITYTELPQITTEQIPQIDNKDDFPKSPKLPARRLKKPAPKQTPTTDDQKTSFSHTLTHRYPDDLNPFGSDPSEEEDEDEDTKYSKSLNPFGDLSDDDSAQEEFKKSPTPAVRTLKKIQPNEDDFKMKSEIGDTPQNLLTMRTRRLTESTNPFGDDDEDDDAKPRPMPRKLVMSNMVLVDVEREGNSLSSISSASEALRRISNNTSFGSVGSLSSISSGGTHSGRKKKAAPRPPIPSFQGQKVKDDDEKSSPITHSPRPRKSRKAPLPPGATSTPQQDLTSDDHGSTMNMPNASPIKQSYVEAINHSILSPTGSIDSGEFEKEKVIKDEVNRNRQSQGYYDNDIKSFQISPPNKSMYGKWKRKKGQAPARPSIPQKRTIKALPIAEVRRELDLIEIQQQGLERQGVRLEQIIRENCEGPDADPEGTVSIEAEDLILQLFEVVNEKNELCRRQAELMYLQRQHRLEEEHADVEYQIRLLMQVPEANKTDSDKANEEELLKRLVDIVERRNEIVECLEMDRLREAEEDDSISSSMNTYVSRREESDTVSVSMTDTLKKKKKFKLKKKLKGITGGSSGKIDKDKDIDEGESSSSMGSLSVKEDKKKKKKKFNLF